MQCLNKFFISTSFSLTNSPNRYKNSPGIQPNRGTHKIHHSRCGEDDSKIASKKSTTLPPNVKTITSTSNPFVKHCVKLRQSSSYRHFHGSVLVVGTTPIREIYSFHKAASDRPMIQCLFVLKNSCIPEEINEKSIHIVEVSSEDVSNSLNDGDCLTLFSFPHRILVLDGIQDPGNLGTLVRSATAFRWDGVFLLPGCCDPFNDKALRACRGACFQIPIVSGHWAHIRAIREEFQMKMLAGHPATNAGPIPVTGLSKDFADSVADSPLCLVLGSEGAGLSEYSRNACELVTIPMAGEFESLNVSVAGGIFMYMLQHEKNRPA